MKKSFWVHMTGLPRHSIVISELPTIVIPAQAGIHMITSESRIRKDEREMNKQLARARDLITSKEPGRRAKFIKKQTPDKNVFTLNESLLAKTEKLLDIKGYITNFMSEVIQPCISGNTLYFSSCHPHF